MNSYEFMNSYSSKMGDFPGGPVVKNLHFSLRELQF